MFADVIICKFHVHVPAMVNGKFVTASENQHDESVIAMTQQFPINVMYSYSDVGYALFSVGYPIAVKQICKLTRLRWR